ncbi:MAG: efflux RND transporter permease subunit [Verrucomicrobiales bacterium]
MEKAIFWFSRNHVAANFLMLLVLIGGLMTWPKLKKEIFPETAIDIVAISVPYPNAAPEEVERGVCVPVEEAIQDLDGIERITSTSVESMGAVLAEVKLGYDTRKVLSDIKVRVDAIDNFPEETEKPVVEELLIKAQVLSIAVSADTDEATLREIAEGVRQDLLNHQMTPAKGKWEKIKRGVVTLLGGEPSITQVKLAGVRNYEIGIEVPEDTLRRFNLNFDQVANAVRFSSLDLPGGAVRTEAGEVLIRANAKRYTAAEFEDIVVASRPDGTEITLEEIARIHDGFEELDVDTRLDAEPTILVNVFRVGDEDTLDLVNLVNDYLDNVAPRKLPEGVNLQIWNDTSVYLKGRMDLLAKNGLWGLLLVFVVLALFLRPSLAFLVSLGIPVAFAGAVALMPTTDISINLISLFAFILVLGIVVDDAIVVGENVFSRMRAGEEPRLAAPRGTHEVGVVVIFGVLTTVAAFTPMLMVGGVSGKIWRNIPWIVVPTLLVSLLQSKFVLPATSPCCRAFRRPESRSAHPGAAQVHRRAGDIRRARLPPGLAADDPVPLRGGRDLHLRVCPHHGLRRHRLDQVPVLPRGRGRDLIRQADHAERRALRADGGGDQPDRSRRQKLAEHQDQAGHSVVRHMLASIGTQPFKTGFEAIGRNPIADNIGEVTLELSPAADRKVTATELISEWRALTGPVSQAGHGSRSGQSPAQAAMRSTSNCPATT